MLVFAYGTLAHRSNQIDSITGYEMYHVKDYSFPFPALVQNITSNQIIKGTIITVNKHNITEFDKKECEGTLYNRQQVMTNDGRLCWVYLASKSLCNYLKVSDKIPSEFNSWDEYIKANNIIEARI